MLPAPIPDNEAERLDSLRRMVLLSTPDEIALDRVTRTARRVFNVPIVLISLLDEGRQWFKSCIGLNVRETGRDISFCGHAIHQESLLVIEDTLLDVRFADNPLVLNAPAIRFYAGRPLRNTEGFMIGTLCVIDVASRRFSGDDRQTLDDFGYWVEDVLMVRQLGEQHLAVLGELDQAQRNALLDPMLNIWNRRAVFDALNREVVRAYRAGNALSLLMLDVDHFKHVNDRYGHPAGDFVLQEIVLNVRRCLRSYDVLGRYGGEEFMVVLPATNASEAQQIAARINETIAELPIVIEHQIVSCTISIGLIAVDYRQQTPDCNALIVAADQALLKAKAAGRNCAVVGQLAD